MHVPRPSRRTCCRADPSRRRAQRAGDAAFTMVELLVAITIVVAMLALTVAGLFSHKDVNRVLATEQLLADMVRQARHTARSSGEPVELRIVQTTDANGNVIGGRVQGVSRQPVWSQSFDDPTNMNSLSGAFKSVAVVGVAEDPDPDTRLTMGRTGNGVWPASSTVSALLADNLPKILVHPLTTAQNIVRGTDPLGRADGFYLACAVRPPAASAAWTAWSSANPTSTSSTGTEIPLVMLGGADGPLPTTCIAGLKLVLTHIATQVGTGQYENLYFWDLQGWVNVPGPPTTVVRFSSMSAFDPVTPTTGPAWPIVGERWEDLALLYDGYSLTLMRNGNALHIPPPGTPPMTVPPHVLVAPAQEFVYIGESQLAGTPPNPTTYADAALDDVRLMRLGSELPQDLPPTVVPETPGTLVFRPDGTATFTADTSTTPLTGTALLPPLVLAQPAQTAAGAITVAMASGTQKITATSPPGPGMLVFSRWTKGMRENGALQAGLVQVPLGNGAVLSWLGSLGRDASSPPVTYLVYSSTP